MRVVYSNGISANVVKALLLLVKLKCNFLQWPCVAYCNLQKKSRALSIVEGCALLFFFLPLIALATQRSAGYC